MRTTVAVGDPQAPLAQFFAVLDAHGLRRGDGRLRDDVALVSMGDHFDWGARERRAQATQDALDLLAWLTSHPPEQVAILVGNHDLARVGELASVDDATWARARAEADAIYKTGDAAAEAAFRARWPMLPSSEVAARDLSAFSAAQRALVEELLATRRFRAAIAPAPDLLLTHAGATIDDLAVAGVDVARPIDAREAADRLDQALYDAVDARARGAPLVVPGLHVPGSGKDGEGRGMLYQRPSDPAVDDDPAKFAGPPRRRFDPRRLPRGLTQACGHIRDAKCRKLMPRFLVDEPAFEGPIRSLRVDDASIVYRRGVVERGPDAALLLFLDNAMLDVDPGAYEVLDLETRAPYRAR